MQWLSNLFWHDPPPSKKATILHFKLIAFVNKTKSKLNFGDIKVSMIYILNLFNPFLLEILT